jgi:hypothetical protein
MRVPVLAYHAVNIAGNEYATNDHVAFAADLRLIDDLGLRIVPLHWVVDQVIGAADRDLTGCVALTCDDGSAFDFHDLDHPTHGPQRSLFNCLQDFIAERGAQAQPDLHLTSFVIASPEARERMDQACLAGLGWMGEDWWREANESGLMAIENHSWDHNHPGYPAIRSLEPAPLHLRLALEIARRVALHSCVGGPSGPMGPAKKHRPEKRASPQKGINA